MADQNPPVFEQVTFFYECLLRFGEAKENRGQLVGAHLQKLTQTIMNGDVIATTDNGPKPLALLDNEDGEKLADVLGEINTKTLMQNQLLTAALAKSESESAGLSNELAGVQESLASKSEKLQASQDEVKGLTEKLDEAQAEIKRLMDLVAAAQDDTDSQ